MDDLPVFLQMFVRFFAVLVAGIWLHNLAKNRAPQSPEAERPAAHAPAQPTCPVTPCTPAVTLPASPSTPAGK
ncbi:MAG: hypothetical protein HYV95_00040 [Opitutae bacterium]|nr:hypothetical protein [Opitutae bacterium]